MYVYSWFIVLTETLLIVRLAVYEINPVQSLTDRRIDRRIDRIVNYSNSRCACARGLMIHSCIIHMEEWHSVNEVLKCQPSARGISYTHAIHVYACAVLLLVGWSINFYATHECISSNWLTPDVVKYGIV